MHGDKFDDCEVVHETNKALLVSIPDLGCKKWIPKDAIHDDSEVYKEDTDGELVLKSWFDLGY